MATIQKDGEQDAAAFRAFQKKAGECSPIKQKDDQLDEVVEQNEIVERAHRGSILENTELFKYLQNQYSDEKQFMTNSIRLNDVQMSDQLKAHGTSNERLTLDEKIKQRKMKLQPQKADPRKTLKNLDISDLGDQKDFVSPCFKKFQPQQTNHFRFDEEVLHDVSVKENEIDIELRNHKVQISNGSDEGGKTSLLNTVNLISIQNNMNVESMEIESSIRTHDDH